MESAIFQPKTVSDAVRHWADVRPEAHALRRGDRTLTWSDLDGAMNNVGLAFSSLGLREGDRVALLGENSLEWVIAFLGSQRAYMIAVPMNTRLAPNQILQQVEKVNARLVLHDENAEIPPGAVNGDARWMTFEQLLDRQVTPAVSTGEVRLPTDSPRPALISFTSGTTGAPKGAVITDDAFFKLATAFSRYFKTSPDDSTLVLVPIFHNTGFADQLAHMLVSGGCTSLMGRYRTNDAAAELISHSASFLAVVPSVLRMLMLHPQADAIFAGTANIMFGGSAMPQAWVHELLSRWPHLKLVNAYGLSEFTSVCTFLSSDLAATKSESVGTALAEVEIRIVDEQGNTLGPDTWGEVWLSGPTRMIGYWDEPELSSAKMPERWLRTGDIGKIDGDGLLWLRGRLDEAINRGGEKIMPALVESQIANHELVAAACVFGYPDPILNERVGAAIQARPGAVVDTEQLAASLRDHLPNYAIPDQWVMYEALLLNASGKFDRIAIRNEFLATHGLQQD